MTPTTHASAFSDPLAYMDPAEAGGGGGRWFTGSSADGYACDVCHSGGPTADLGASGLPLDGYMAGESYEVSLTWPPQVGSLALIAELTDEQRHGAGTLALPREDALGVDELCAPEEGAAPAAELHPADLERTLLSVVDCGAKLVRFQWTAPPGATGTVWFNVGFVSGDEDATPLGDGVTLVRRSLQPAGHSTGTRPIAQGCAIQPGTPRSSGAFAVGVFVLAARRRRRHGPASWVRRSV